MDFRMVRIGLGVSILASAFFFIAGSVAVSLGAGILTSVKGYSNKRTVILGLSIVTGVTLPFAWTWYWLVGVWGVIAFALFSGLCFLAPRLAMWIAEELDAWLRGY